MLDSPTSETRPRSNGRSTVQLAASITINPDEEAKDNNTTSPNPDEEAKDNNTTSPALPVPWFSTRWPDIIQLITELLGKWEDSTTKERAFQMKGFFVKMKRPGRVGLDLLPEQFYDNNGALLAMYKAVLNAPAIFLSPITTTTQLKKETLTLTKYQAFALLSCSFFGLFPNYPLPDLLHSRLSLCLANYFIRMTQEFKDAEWKNRKIQIERRVLLDEEVPDWKNSNKTLCGLKIVDMGLGIEDLRVPIDPPCSFSPAQTSVQVNFADPTPGGTLPSRYPDIVQEEILFLIYPELFITPLLCPIILQNEALAVRGVTRTNKYQGYRNSFQFDGDFTLDKNDCTILHIDALPGRCSSEMRLLHNLNKAYLGFSLETDQDIGTGHWGCGAFGCDHHFQAIIQLLAAGQAEKDLAYACYQTPLSGFKEMHKNLKENNVPIREIYECVLARGLENASGSDLFDHLNSLVNSKD